MNRRIAFILLFSLVACSSLYIIEQVIEVSYLVKTLSKVAFFVVGPLIYLYLFKEGIKFKLTRSEVKYGLMLGFSSFAIVLVAYFLFRSLIDTDSILTDLANTHISASNFLLIGLYITFGNSFLEEFFFRGFIFLKLYDCGLKTFAYLFSAGLFAVYHIAIFATWFSPLIILLALLGLFTIGIIFNFVNIKSKSFINSWIIHICADIAIILIGLRLFEMI